MINQIYSKTAIFLLILMLGLSMSPVASYAHDDDDDDDRREDRQEKVENGNKKFNKTCRKMFQRLFTRGFFNNNSDVNAFIECLRPFGINATFNGQASSTDTTAPIISDLSVKPNKVKATISWHTDEKSDSTVFWSTTAGVNLSSSTTANVTKNGRVKNHSVLIENLTASTTYYLVVRSRDNASNTSTSSEISFQTKGATVADSIAPTITNVATLIGTSTINVSWNTNENATSRLYYSTSTPLDVNATTTNFIENATPKIVHSLPLSGLSTSTQYYLAAESKDGTGNRTITPTFNVTTSN